MPEFHLDTSGDIMVPRAAFHPLKSGEAPLGWADLDAFTQGYVEALFFTESGDEADGKEIGDAGFADLAPESLAAILADCAAFQATYQPLADAISALEDQDTFCWEDEAAGRDFWYTRNGHGCGFWDGDWPEPYATQLSDAANAFRAVDVCLGDDGKVYLS